MHRFKRNFYGFGLFFCLAALFVGGFAYLGHALSVGIWIATAGLLLVAVPLFLFYCATTFSDADRCVTYVKGFFPFLSARQIRYDDVEKLVLTGATKATQNGTYAQYDLKLFVRGNPAPLLIKSCDEQEIRRYAPIVEAIAAVNRFPLEKAPGYDTTRDKYDGTRDKRHAQSKYTLAAGAVGLLVAGYFALAVPKSSTSQGVEVVGLILGMGLGMIGIATYFQTKG